MPNTTMNSLRNSITEMGARIREAASALAVAANDESISMEEVQRQQAALRAMNERMNALQASYNAQFGENAGTLQIRYKNPRKNTVKVLLLMDSGGSMDYYSGLCSMLFQAATKSNRFKELHTYYFHNCIYSNVYETPRMWGDAVDTEWLLKNYDSSYKVIIVGDATMAPGELWEKRYNWGQGTYGPSGLEWLERFRKQYPYLIWLNPEPMPATPSYWSKTHYELGRLFEMYELSTEGLEAGMKRLMVRR